MTSNSIHTKLIIRVLISGAQEIKCSTQLQCMYTVGNHSIDVVLHYIKSVCVHVDSF